MSASFHKDIKFTNDISSKIFGNTPYKVYMFMHAVEKTVPGVRRQCEYPIFYDGNSSSILVIKINGKEVPPKVSL